MIRDRRSDERRQFGRRQTLWHAWAKVAGREREACIVRNFSVVGALLEFTGAAPVADRLRLVIDAYGFEAECYVRHRSKLGLGVNFDELAMAEARSVQCTPEELLAILKREHHARGH